MGDRGGRTCLLIELGIIEPLDDFGDGLDGPVPAVRVGCQLGDADGRNDTGPGPGRGQLGGYILKFPPTKNWRAMIAV